MTKTKAADDPVAEFGRWFEKAKARRDISLPEAVCLSTLDRDGFPNGRMVLLKEFDERGFVFYTNFKSNKGRALESYPKATLTFHWEKLERQVRVQGAVEKVGDAEADDYFHSRPRMSQLGAWASDQSQVLPGRLALIRRFLSFRRKFRGGPVPRPPHWGGFRLVPSRIEFWRARPFRLHDRFLYTRTDNGWKKERLSP